jgi:hypothetical protein
MCRSIVCLLGLVFAAPGLVEGSTSAEFDAMRANFPQGIPWHIEIFDTSGSPVGVLDVLITSRHAKSCSKGFGSGYLVSYSRSPIQLDLLPGSWRLGTYGVASIDDNTISIDLTGGRCNDFVFTEGHLRSDGASNGRVFVKHRQFGNDMGTYFATLRHGT